MSDVNANLEELFPELQGLLDGWDTNTTPRTNGNGYENENGVGLSEIEQAMQTRLASMPMAPQFQSGQTAPPPPAAHVEDGGPSGQPQPQPAPQPTPQQQVQPAPPPPPASVEPVQPGQGQPDPSAQPPAPAADEVEIGQNDDGTPIRVPLARLQAYAQFDQEFQNDAGLREAVLKYYGGEQQAQPQQQAQQAPPVADDLFPTTPPAEVPQLDLEDPAIRFLVQQQQALGEQVRMLAGGVQATHAQQQQQAQAQMDGLIKRAMESFKTQHGLNDQQMEDVRQAAARLNVVPSLMQGVDPISGAPSKPDPLTALDRSFEIAMMMNPQHRQQEFAREIQQRVVDRQRKQKLAGLSGSSGSVPRTSPAPTTAQGRRQAMIDEIRQMQEGQWAPPES